MVTIEDEAVPLADRAVLGASRRPQTSDDSDAWNLGFVFSLTSLGAWLVLKRKEH
jgi:LPXTG-motif cell wall-anchored protein